MSQIETQLELLPPKSKICNNDNPKYWVVWIENNNIIIPEDILKKFNLLQESKHGWYIHSQLKPYIKLIELQHWGTKRRGRYYIKAIYNPDGSTRLQIESTRFPNDSEAITQLYNDMLSLWETALKSVVVPQTNIDKHVGEWRADITVYNIEITIQWKKTYTVINSNNANILNLILTDTRIQQLGFAKGMYGGLISKKQVEEKDVKNWISSIADIVVDILSKNMDVLKKEIMAKIEAQKKDIEIAREKLGIKKPADQSITIEDILSLVKQSASSTPASEEEEIEVEEIEEQKPQKQLELSLPEMELELEESPILTAVEMRKEEKAEAPAPSKRELVKIYLLSMRLPSRYLVQKISMEENSNGFVEKREFDGVRAQIASRLEGIRRTAYERISRVFAYVEEFGTWIAVTEDGVREAQEVSKWIREELSKIPELRNIKDVDLSKYDVRAIPIWMSPEDAKELLQCAIKHLSEDVEELERKINEALNEQNKRALSRLEKDRQYKRALLEALKSYLSQI